MDKYISPEKIPTGYNREILEILAEECSEVIKRVQKAQRFGLKEIQSGQYYNNIERISLEIGDLLYIIDELKNTELLSKQYILIGYKNKEKQLLKYLQNSRGYV